LDQIFVSRAVEKEEDFLFFSLKTYLYLYLDKIFRIVFVLD